MTDEQIKLILKNPNASLFSKIAQLDCLGVRDAERILRLLCVIDAAGRSTDNN